MPLPVISDVFRVAFVWTLSSGGSYAVNVMHFRDVLGTQDSDDLDTAIEANFNTNLIGSCSTSSSITTLTITPLDGSTASTDYSPGVAAHFTGGSSGEPIPQSAAIVKLTTALRGRSYRGRVFLPFTAENAQANGALGSVIQGIMQDAWDVFVPAMVADDWAPVIASYLHATAEDVTGQTVELETGTQRRRQSRNRL